MKELVKVSEQIHSNLLNEEFVVLFFHSSWCGPCKTFHPVLEEIAARPKYQSVFFGSVDVDKERDISKRYHLRTIPTIIGLHKGKVIFQHSGDIKEADFEFDLNALLAA